MTAVTQDQFVSERAPCSWHPEVETGLRCNRCDRPICAKCAVRVPVGYKCRACVEDIKAAYLNGKRYDYLIAIAVALPLSLLTAILFTCVIAVIGWFPWFIAFLTAPTIGGFIAEAVRRGVKKRRSRYLANVVAGCFVAAILPFLILPVLAAVSPGLSGTGVCATSLLELGILLVLGTGTIMARLKW
jgi:hypothetical protein